jgi:hypothetical protein
MMLVLGRMDEYKALLQEIDERKEQHSQDLWDLRKAQDEGRAMTLIDSWRDENLKVLSSRSISYQRGGA